jgi:hypothetical protein
VRGELIAAGLLLAVARAAAGQTIVRRVAIAPDAAIRIFNLVGSTEVIGWDRDSLVVTATIPPGGGDFVGGASERSAKYGVQAVDQSLGGPGSKFVVQVPRAARLAIKSATATVTVSGVLGEVEVTSVTGPVRVEGSPRVVTIDGIDGRIDVVGPATLTRVKSGSGVVQLMGVRGEFTVTTVEGAATVVTDEILSGRIETVSGRVDVTGALPVGARLDLTTHDGDVQAHLVQPVDAHFDLATIEGRIVTHLFDRDRVYRDRGAAFSVGPSAGTQRGARVTVRTFKGSIRVDSNPKRDRGV